MNGFISWTSKQSIAQQSDILAHKERYNTLDNLTKFEDNRKIVLYGASRGAATTFSALARMMTKYLFLKDLKNNFILRLNIKLILYLN